MGKHAEEHLVAASRDGDLDAFSELVLMHQGQVRAYIAGIVHDRDAAEDVAQETFLAAYRGIEEFRSDAPVRLWLLGIGRNKALAYLREARRRAARESSPLARTLAMLRAQSLSSDPADEALDAAGGDSAVDALRRCVAKLTGNAADLLDAYYRDGRRADELAAQTGRTANAVRLVLSRLRARLRTCVETSLATGGDRA